MMQMKITIPDRLVEKIENHELEESELITKALDKFFNGKPFFENNQWQRYMEEKIIDLQDQIDTHLNTGNHDGVLNSNVTKRNMEQQNSLDISNADDIRLTTPNNKTKKIPEVIESSLEDFDIPL